MDKKDESKKVVPMTKLPLAADARFEDFYVPPPSKKKGEGPAKMTGFMMGEATHRDLEIFLLHHKDKFPWETVSDFMRWAVEFGIAYAAKCADDGKVLMTSAQRRVMWGMMALQKTHQEFARKMDQTEATINELLDQGHRQPVVKSLLEMKRIINKEMGDDPYWQKVYREEFERRFARHLKRASLTRFSEDEE